MISLLFLVVLLSSCRKKAPVQAQHTEEAPHPTPPPPKAEEPECVIESGEVALITYQGILDPHGRLWEPTDCYFEVNSTIRLYYGEPPI